MKIVADENLAFTDYFFSEFGEIQHLAGRTLQQSDVKDADALLVRSVTKVDAKLVAQTALQFVGSATIGTDHLNIQDLKQHHIEWANAAGCNAQAVAEYVITALLTIQPALIETHTDQKDRDFCLGILGYGNVGKRLAKLALYLGWRVLICDPFISENDVKIENSDNLPTDQESSRIRKVDFNTLLSDSNAISIHVPLTKTGNHATHHLFDHAAFSLLPKQTILINSARGSVIEEAALLEDLKHTQRLVVLDVFEHEPLISQKLLDNLALATPHIAGYSLEGKARGTEMIYQHFCQYFKFDANKHFESQLPICPQIFQQEKPLQHDIQQTFKSILLKYLTTFYDIRRDDQQLRACLKDGMVDQEAFDHLRKHYPLRREWSAYGAKL